MNTEDNEKIIDELLYGNGTEGSGLIGATPDGDFVKWDTTIGTMPVRSSVQNATNLIDNNNNNNYVRG